MLRVRQANLRVRSPMFVVGSLVGGNTRILGFGTMRSGRNLLCLPSCTASGRFLAIEEGSW